MEKRSWFASGKERKAGSLLRFTLIALTGVAFAAGAIVVLITSGGQFGSALLWGLICAAVAAVIGVIVWFAYAALVLKKQK